MRLETLLTAAIRSAGRSSWSGDGDHVELEAPELVALGISEPASTD
jgi:hypothetical protein